MSVTGLLTRDECESIIKRIGDRLPSAVIQIQVESVLESKTSFARNSTWVSSEYYRTKIFVLLETAGRRGFAETNQTTDKGLDELAANAELASDSNPTLSDGKWKPIPAKKYPTPPKTYFEATEAMLQPEPQSTIVASAIEASEVAKFICAGELGVTMTARAVGTPGENFVYEASSYGEMSMTVRGQDHNASGWAWSGFEDWARVDTKRVIERSIDLARRSANPVAVEPGRYTVILEPEAVAQLMEPIANNNVWHWAAGPADAGLTVYGKKPQGTNKMGLQMMDRRFDVVSSPWDPDRPTGVIDPNSQVWGPLRDVKWFDKGVLKNLAYDEEYASIKGREVVPAPNGFRLMADGPPTSLEDMIANTKRGVWVSRLSNVSMVNNKTLLLTGTTRDGTFLIENGKVTKSIKNFRFTDSPFFAMNQVEAWGDPVRASSATIVPRLKIRDFDFTSLTDAI